MRGWKTTYLRELATKVKAGEEDLSIKRFPATVKRVDRCYWDRTWIVRCGRTLRPVSFRDIGGVVNTSIAIAVSNSVPVL